MAVVYISSDIFIENIILALVIFQYGKTRNSRPTEKKNANVRHGKKKKKFRIYKNNYGQIFSLKNKHVKNKNQGPYAH